jgi:hypothetical protein
LARVGRLARLRGDWPPAIGRLFERGLAPVGLAGLIGPRLVCWGWPGWLARLLGAIGGGLQRLGRVGWPPVDWGGVGPRAIGRGGAIGP